MDPTQCMINILCLGLIGDAEMMMEQTNHLKEWLDGGGFPPDQLKVLAWLTENAIPA